MTTSEAADALRSTCSEVVAGAWIGGELAAIPDGVTAVVTLEQATPASGLAGVVELRLHLRDTRWEPVLREPLEAAIQAVVCRDGPILVRCQHGLNRSALVVGLALRQLGHDASEVVALVRAVRPNAFTNPYFLDLLRTYPRDPMQPDKG